MRIHRDLVAILSLLLYTLAHSLECYIPPPDVASRHFVPTTFHACYPILKFLVRHERVDLPLHFSRRPGVGYLVPAQWTSGNCVVSIDVQSSDDVETASFGQIAHEAGLVLLGCVVQPPHLGGSQWVGEQKVMKVTVFGYRREDPPLASVPLLLSAKSPMTNISGGQSHGTA